MCCQDNKSRDGECPLGLRLRDTEGEAEVDLPQQHGDGPPKEKYLLLSGTFLTFHLRKMPHGQMSGKCL